MSDDVRIRRAESIDDYRACQIAQRRAWGITEDGYVVPVATLVSAQLHGGLVLGAFTPDGQAVGLSFAFLGRIDGRLGLYSQLTGVVPEYQGQGLGGQLKQAQWQFALDQGLDVLAWAFDPLQAGNAHFNLEKLGVAADRLVPNMYGMRTDSLNAGVPTDRLIAEWRTQAEPRRPTDVTEVIDAPRWIVVETLANGLRHPDGLKRTAAHRVLIEIPEDVASLRANHADLAEQWRLAVRDAFTHAFRQGYRATGMIRPTEDGARRYFYVLSRAEQPQNRPRGTHNEAGED